MKLLDAVVTLKNLPGEKISNGQVGTIVDELAPGVVMVEFADLGGVAHAIEPIPIAKLMQLRHASALAAWVEGLPKRARGEL